MILALRPKGFELLTFGAKADSAIDASDAPELRGGPVSSAASSIGPSSSN